MRIVKSFLALMVVFSLLLSTTVFSNAAEDRFIAIDVAEYNEYGDQIVKKHAFYTDGKYLYASIDTLDRYTFYDYDEQYSAFVRVGQDYRLSLSKTTLDFENKKATVKMINGEKEYKLHNVIKFGDEYYLPLDQMCAFLMASVDFIDNKLIIKNSGFSIADAAYNYNNYSYVFNYNDIVDGIFAGNEDLYFVYCVVGFYGSSIFGLRVKNLDLISKSGDAEYYQDFLQTCITDYDEYLKTQSDADTFEKRVNQALSVTEGLSGILKIAKNTTTVSKAAYELFEDTKDVANLDIEYIEVGLWDDTFDALSISLSYVEYFTKFISMTEDHKSMIEDCALDTSVKDAGMELKTAILHIRNLFGQDIFSSLVAKTGEVLIEKLPGALVEEYASVAVPYLAVIKAVNSAFKLFGFDLSDNSQYSVMLEGLANSYLADRYSVLKNDAGKTKEASEKFRRAAIFSLLASKNAFESGNSLDKKLEGSGTLFNDEIDVVCARLNLFYRAAESSCYENIESIDDVIKENQESFKKSNIINTSRTISSPTDIKSEPATLTDYIGITVDEFVEVWGENYEVYAYRGYGVCIEHEDCPFTPYIEVKNVDYNYLGGGESIKNRITGKEKICSIYADKSCDVPVVKKLSVSEKLNTIKNVLGDDGDLCANGHTSAIGSYDVENKDITYSFTWDNNGGTKSLSEKDMNQVASSSCSIYSASIFEETVPAETTTSTNSTLNSDENDLKKLYYDYVENNNSYFEYDGIHSDFEPQFYFVDLDNDSVEEAILSVRFESTDSYVYQFARIHVLDISDNVASCVFSSDTVGQSRMTEKIRVYKDNGNYYISRTWRDGNNIQLGTLYIYDGNRFIPQYGLVGCINGPVYFTIGNGKDAFKDKEEGYEDISKEEFLKLQNDLDEKGQTVFYSSDLFE